MDTAYSVLRVRSSSRSHPNGSSILLFLFSPFSVVQAHFDYFCQGQKPVIFDRPVKVIDINFGLNNQDTILNMKKRGALARVLDLQQDKLDLMLKYNIHGPKEITKQDQTVRVLRVKFLQASPWGGGQGGG